MPRLLALLALGTWLIMLSPYPATAFLAGGVVRVGRRYVMPAVVMYFVCGGIGQTVLLTFSCFPYAGQPSREQLRDRTHASLR